MINFSGEYLDKLFPYSLLLTMSETTATEAADKNVEIWKVKKLIKSLEAARGNGTSMISLIISPGIGINVFFFKFN